VSRGLTAPLVAAALAFLAPAAARAHEVIRIAVASGQAEVEVAGTALAAEALQDGARRMRLPHPRARVRLEGNALLLDGMQVEGAGLSFTASGPIRHGARALSGEVEVRRGRGGLQVIDVLPLDDYVAAVVGAEMPLSFPPEALKAQAVAARTFALVKKLEARDQGLDFDLGATVLDQVYPGAGSVDGRARAAAAATHGEVLVHGHRPIEAYFHSACGGRTESGAEGLGREAPYLRAVECGRCGGAPRYRWRATISAADLGAAVGLGRPATGARVVRRTATGRADRLEVEAGDRRAAIGGADLRRRLGYERVPSLAFALRAANGGFVLEGQGAGHGAGLCQWGAAGSAREGQGYRQILRHYYPGAELVKMY
jgi:stage II sporulation protein D